MAGACGYAEDRSITVAVVMAFVTSEENVLAVLRQSCTVWSILHLLAFITGGVGLSQHRTAGVFVDAAGDGGADPEG